MATYIVGDVQGCFLTFQKLLNDIEFDTNNDLLILLGDVINRGPLSLPMLRYIKSHDSCMQMILGNHEIFAIALALDVVKSERPHTLQDLLSARDKIELIEYLRMQPLLRQMNQHIFVHAGILPDVTLSEAFAYAHELSEVLSGRQAEKFLCRYFEKIPTSRKNADRHKRELRLALAYFTLIRMCESTTAMDLSYSGTPEKAPKRLKPWYALRDDKDVTIFFGHWAALGFQRKDKYICLDSGCAWGNSLTAIRLPDFAAFQVPNIDKL